MISWTHFNYDLGRVGAPCLPRFAHVRGDNESSLRMCNFPHGDPRKLHDLTYCEGVAKIFSVNEPERVAASDAFKDPERHRIGFSARTRDLVVNAELVPCPEVQSMLAPSCAQAPLDPGVDAPGNVPALDGIVAMRVDYETSAAILERIMPRLKRWVEQR